MAARRLPAKPDGAVLTGRFVRLVPYDVETHLVGTYEALSGMSSFGHPSYDATTLVWQYLRSVKCPVSTMDDMEHTLKRVRDLGDARLFVVQLLPSWTELAAAKDASAAAAAEGPIIGVVAYLANRPADLAIEIGMVAYTPAFQGTVSVASRSGAACVQFISFQRYYFYITQRLLLIRCHRLGRYCCRFHCLLPLTSHLSPSTAARQHGGDVPAAAARLGAGLPARGVEVQLAERAVQGGGPAHRLCLRGHAQVPHDRGRRRRQQPQPRHGLVLHAGRRVAREAGGTGGLAGRRCARGPVPAAASGAGCHGRRKGRARVSSISSNLKH